MEESKWETWCWTFQLSSLATAHWLSRKPPRRPAFILSCLSLQFVPNRSSEAPLRLWVTLRSSSLCNHSCDRGQRRCWITCRNNSRDRELWTRGHRTDMTASLRSPDIRFPSYWLYSLSGLSYMWKSRQACSADPALGVLANVTRFVKLFLNTFEAWSKT